MTKTMRLAAAAVVAVSMGAPAWAGGPEELKSGSEGFAATVSQAAAQAPERSPIAPAPATPAPGIPEFAKDAFQGVAECGIVDNYNETHRPDQRLGALPPIAEAVKLLQPCAAAVSKKYGVEIMARSGGFKPTTDGPIQPHLRISGIILRLSGRVAVGNSVLIDLKQALADRGNRLFGYPAQVAVQPGPLGAGAP